MANWCEGNIKLRGTKENIKKFLDNEIVYITGGYDNIKEEKPEKTDDDYVYVLVVPEIRYSFYIRNTKRNFFFTSRIEVYFPDCKDDEEIIICINDFNSAWALYEDGWVDHAKNYNIDIRLLGFERGMQFSQVMTITRDGSVETKQTEYENYDWDCPFPNLGG